MIELNHDRIPVSRQCGLLGLSRSTFYYECKGMSATDLKLMGHIDEQFTRTPFYGSRRIAACLRQKGYEVNRKKVARLMHKMGLQAIYPKRRLSIPDKEHKVYPYLLKGVVVNRPNQVWSIDITYVRLKNGFVYLVAIIDWYSRYVLSWELSVSLTADFCVTALENALRIGRPEIFNSDQGSQFTSEDFIKVLQRNNIMISMDGRGRVFDNIFVERLWRSVKYEEVYIHDYETVADAKKGLKKYFTLYNYERPHQSLNYQQPYEVYNQAVRRAC